MGSFTESGGNMVVVPTQYLLDHQIYDASAEWLSAAA